MLISEIIGSVRILLGLVLFLTYFKMIKKCHDMSYGLYYKGVIRLVVCGGDRAHANVIILGDFGEYPKKS